jgi:hypothetical protein
MKEDVFIVLLAVGVNAHNMGVCIIDDHESPFCDHCHLVDKCFSEFRRTTTSPSEYQKRAITKEQYRRNAFFNNVKEEQNEILKVFKFGDL